MAKNDWARNAFRKAQNLMSRGYNDFEPATVVTKNELSNLKNTLLDKDSTQPANGWTKLDESIFPSHLQGNSNGYADWGDMQGTRDQNPIHDSTRNPILDAAEDALSLAGVTHAFTEDDPIQDLSEVPDATSWDEWYEEFNDPETPAISPKQAEKGIKLGTDTIRVLETKLISDPNLTVGEKVSIGVKIQSIKRTMKDLDKE